jgi:hypothetical protein
MLNRFTPPDEVDGGSHSSSSKLLDLRLDPRRSLTNVDLRRAEDGSGDTFDSLCETLLGEMRLGGEAEFRREDVFADFNDDRCCSWTSDDTARVTGLSSTMTAPFIADDGRNRPHDGFMPVQTVGIGVVSIFMFSAVKTSTRDGEVR